MAKRKNVFFRLIFSQLIILILALILGTILGSGNWLSKLFEFRWIYLLIALLGFVVYYVSNIVLGNLIPKRYYTSDNEFDKLNSQKSLLYIVISCVIVAFCEELLFRGILQGHFGILFATIMFVLAHFRYMKKVFLILYLFLISFILGIVFILANHTLMAPIILHFLIDFIVDISTKYSKTRR